MPHALQGPNRIPRLYVEELFQRESHHHLAADAELRRLKNAAGAPITRGLVLQRSTSLLLGAGAGTGEPPHQMIAPATNVAGHFGVAQGSIPNGDPGDFKFRGRMQCAVATALPKDTLLKAGIATGQLVAATPGSKIIAQLEQDSAGGGALAWCWFDGLNGLGDQVLPAGASSSFSTLVGLKVVKSLTPTVTVPNLAAGGNESEVFTVTELGTLAAGDWIEAIPAANQAVTGGTIAVVGVTVAAANQIEIHWNNSGTAGAVPSSGNYTLVKVL